MPSSFVRLLDLLGPSRPARCAWIAADALPPVPRRLLDHPSDMTSTLEAHHGESMRLEVLERVVQGDRLMRRVALRGAASDRVTEVGAICIHLARFDDAARREIEAGSRPLGALLAAHDVPYASRPLGFLQLHPTPGESVALGLPRCAAVHYGRVNVLRHPDRGVLAEVVEILPC
ncbi:MAG: hypothetical protein AAF772_08565 [Acidobacteriota bacterium]